MKTKYEYKDGITTTTILYKGKKFIGEAKCHPDDKDLESSWTGSYISENRAIIKLFSHIRDNELRPHLEALQQLYYSMSRSKYYDPESYEAKMLQRAIYRTRKSLQETKISITRLKEDLRDYIQTKEQWYTLIRKRRAGQDKITSSK